MNTKIPKHIDPRELRKKALEADKTDLRNLAVLMKESGSTPWRYVRASYKKLVEGEYEQAWNWLNYAGEFAGIFYEEDSPEDEQYRDEINLLKYQLLVLIERFKSLRPEEE